MINEFFFWFPVTSSSPLLSLSVLTAESLQSDVIPPRFRRTFSVEQGATEGQILYKHVRHAKWDLPKVLAKHGRVVQTEVKQQNNGVSALRIAAASLLPELGGRLLSGRSSPLIVLEAPD